MTQKLCSLEFSVNSLHIKACVARLILKSCFTTFAVLNFLFIFFLLLLRFKNFIIIKGLFVSNELLYEVKRKHHAPVTLYYDLQQELHSFASFLIMICLVDWERWWELLVEISDTRKKRNGLNIILLFLSALLKQHKTKFILWQASHGLTRNHSSVI